MARVSPSREATFDVLEIWARVARHDVAAADRLTERIHEATELSRFLHISGAR